jgi:phosphoenolpyruvate synthase/pyruvate phosphate dikinase
VQDHVSILEELRQQLTNVLDPAGTYAVRSSANIEDALEGSFAGQFKTILGVQGEQGIIKAIQSIWSSVNSPGVGAYDCRYLHFYVRLSLWVMSSSLALFFNLIMLTESIGCSSG